MQKLKETTQTKKYVKEVFKRALTVMEIEYKVKLVFSDKEYNEYIKKETGMDKRARQSRNLGTARMNAGVRTVTIRIQNHKSVKGLNDTIVHELLHAKDFTLSHGKRFDKTVEDYLKLMFDYGYDRKENKVIEYQGSKY